MPKDKTDRHFGGAPIAFQPRHALVKLIRVLGEELNALAKKNEAHRRLVWMIIHEQGGRVELNRAAYQANLQGPAEDFIFKLEDNKPNNVVSLLECNEQGEEVSKIIRL